MIYDVELLEPCGGFLTSDSALYTADSASAWPTADSTIVPAAADAAYAAINGNVLLVDVFEPVSSVITADTTSYSADETQWPDASGGTLDGARDATDAEVEAAELPSYPAGPWHEPRRAVVGYGLGVLPRLAGEAHGTVGNVGLGSGVLNLVGEAVGEGEDLTDEILLMLLLAA